MIELEVDGLEELDSFARALAAALMPRDVLELQGEVGAGKTTLVWHLARALGIREPVRSPTYTVAQGYAHPDGERSLAHLDLYRGGSAALDVEGYADLEPLLDTATWTCIEWPGPIESWLAGRARWQLQLETIDATRRAVRIEAPSRAREGALRAAAAR